MASRGFAIALTVSLIGCSLVAAQGANQQNYGPTLAKIPGAQTAAAALAASSDGISRYLAPNGPIQPALGAAAGLPVRGAELANRGISRISAGFGQGAQRLSRAAGQNGQIQMPGMQALESSMPTSIASLGQSMQGMIQGKNNFIRSQLDSAVDSANRLGKMAHQGFQGMSVRSSGPANMMSSAQDFMAKSSSELQGQVKKHLNEAMGRLGSVQGIGDNVRNQAEGITRTLSSGLQGAASQLQRTGENVLSQIQRGHSQNTQALSNVMGSLQGSMGSMSGNMQKNLDGVIKHAQSTAQQLSGSLQEHLHQAVQAPMEILSNLGNMMSKGMGGSSSSGGRY